MVPRANSAIRLRLAIRRRSGEKPRSLGDLLPGAEVTLLRGRWTARGTRMEIMIGNLPSDFDAWVSGLRAGGIGVRLLDSRTCRRSPVAVPVLARSSPAPHAGFIPIDDDPGRYPS